MNPENFPHLNENQIIQSLVEKADLPPALREHLSSCSQCKIARENLEGNLTRLGEMAMNSAPPLQKKIILSCEQQRKTYQWLWEWRGISALTAAAGVVLMLAGLVSLNNTQQRTLAKLNEEMLKDERFMTEISKLERSDLPQSWLDISGEFDVNIDEEMLEVISPGS
jgi:hypothetical protein